MINCQTKKNKFTLEIVKGDKKVFRYLSYLKLNNFARNEAKLKSIFNDGSVILYVEYPLLGKGYWNEKECRTPSDLKWAVEAFVKEYRDILFFTFDGNKKERRKV